MPSSNFNRRVVKKINIEIKSTLINIFEELGIDPNKDIASQIDSLDFVSLILEIEDTFDITIPEHVLDMADMEIGILNSLISEEVSKQGI